jgi:hypothetical protein
MRGESKEEGLSIAPMTPILPVAAVLPPPPPASALSTTNAASLAKHRQMKGLKRKKRKFTRNIQAPSSTNQKNTNFDYGTFRQFNALLPNQRVDALITPGKKAWSPLSKVTRDWSILKAQLAASASKRRLLAGKYHRDHAKIAKLKVLNNLLMVDLHRERRVSNKMIDEAMVKARPLSDEALEMMAKANEMCITERNRASSRIRKERAHHSRQSERLGRKQATSIEKLH